MRRIYIELNLLNVEYCYNGGGLLRRYERCRTGIYGNKRETGTGNGIFFTEFIFILRFCVRRLSKVLPGNYTGGLVCGSGE